MTRRKEKNPIKSRLLEISSLFVFSLGVFVLIALITYHPNDPSFLSNSQQSALNACGWVGAYLAAILLQGLGFGAFLCPAALFFLGATIYQKDSIARMLGIMAGMIIAVISLTVLLEIHWKFLPYAGTSLATGGIFGSWVSETLQLYFNPVGATIVSALIFSLTLVLSTPLSVVRFIAKTGRHLGLIIWKILRFATSALVYIGSVVLMRLAHATGDFVQKGLEMAVQRAKERATAIREARLQKRLEMDSEGSTEAEPHLAIEDQSNENQEDFEDPTVEPEQELEGEEARDEISVALLREEMSPKILPTELSLSKTGERNLKKFQRQKNGPWKLPTPEFLRKPPKVESNFDKERLYENSKILKQKFADFGIEGEITAVRPGPVITLYEFKPGPGIKVSRIASLVDDLSMALSAESVRILAPLPGKSVVGIEIPSENRETVFLREFLQHPDFHGEKSTIPVVMGQDIGGQTVLSDLARMPHLLVAGQTGSGKSVFMNSLICSLLYRFTPDDLRMILIDPKFIEFRGYQDIPHLLLPVVDDPKEASTTLKWAVREMERRYRILAALGARNLESFNKKVEEMGSDVVEDLLVEEENNSSRPARSKGSDWIEAFEPDENGERQIGKLPYIIVIVDELADLMMIARKEVEISIARIAQKARAAGIHLVVATQRPSTDVITGLIKANLPSRVSFKLASHIDSKTILDRAGSERLLGQGDMLFVPPGTTQIQRLHGAFVDDDEIHKITAFLKSQGKPLYRDEILLEEEDEGSDFDDSEKDELFDQAVELVKESGHASASFLQRHLKVGYNRAARLIETMETAGIVGPADGARPREVLLD